MKSHRTARFANSATLFANFETQTTDVCPQIAVVSTVWLKHKNRRVHLSAVFVFDEIKAFFPVSVESRQTLTFICFVCPRCHSLSHALLEGVAKGAVTAEAALVGQLLGCEGALRTGSLAIETDEMVNAQIVDIGIVSHALTGEILAEVESVGTNNLGQLGKGQVMLQVKLRAHATLSQLLLDIGGNDQRLLCLCRKLWFLGRLRSRWAIRLFH